MASLLTLGSVYTVLCTHTHTNSNIPTTPRALRNMKQLRHLNLSGSSRLSHQGALYLSNQHPHLTYLNLNNTAVSNSDDDFLTRFANLEQLVLSRTDFCSGMGIDKGWVWGKRG